MLAFAVREEHHAGDEKHNILVDLEVRK